MNITGLGSYNSNQYRTVKMQNESKDETKFTEYLAEKNEASDEKRTQTNIVVRPDGSRVLMITTKVGGMESTMSLKISEPTDMSNEAEKEEKQTVEQQSIEGRSDIWITVEK